MFNLEVNRMQEHKSSDITLKTYTKVYNLSKEKK